MSIPRSFIDEVLSRTDIVSVIERVVPLKKKGNNYSGLCPFHGEKTPSFSVSAQKQFYYCFGCQASGNAITFLMEHDRLSFVDTIEMLANAAGLQVPVSVTQQETDLTDQYAMLNRASDFYRAQLQNTPEAQHARDYFKKRGLSDATIQRFQLGFAPSGWDHLLRAEGQHHALLLKVGLIIENDQHRLYDRFRNRVMFPIHDRRGRTIGFGGRVMDDSQPKYLNSPESPVFHKGHELYGLYEAKQANPHLSTLIVVEGYMDVIGLAEHGVTHAVATLGTAVTSAHLKRLINTCQKIIFCFDGDRAGQNAAWKALEAALPQLHNQTEIQFCFLPTGEDPDSFVRREGAPAFFKRLSESKSLAEYFFEKIAEQVNLEKLEGRSQCIALAMPYLQLIKADIIKTLLLNELASITHADLRQLEQWSSLEQEAPALPQRSAVLRKARGPQQRHTPVRHAIALLLQHPHVGEKVTETIPQSGLPGLPLLNELIGLTKQHPHLSTGAIIEHWRDRPEVKHLAQLAALELLTPPGGVASELNDTLKNIHLLIIEQEIEQLLARAKTEALSQEEKNRIQQLLVEKTSRF